MHVLQVMRTIWDSQSCISGPKKAVTKWQFLLWCVAPEHSTRYRTQEVFHNCLSNEKLTLCARHHAKLFTYIISFHSHKNCTEKASLSPIYTEGIWGLALHNQDLKASKCQSKDFNIFGPQKKKKK